MVAEVGFVVPAVIFLALVPRPILGGLLAFLQFLSAVRVRFQMAFAWAPLQSVWVFLSSSVSVPRISEAPFGCGLIRLRGMVSLRLFERHAQVLLSLCGRRDCFFRRASCRWMS